MAETSNSKAFTDSSVSVLGYEVYSVFSKVDRAGLADDALHLPIVFIHGAIVSHLYWMPTVRLLAETHDVYALDLPGHGRSSKPAKTLGVIEQADVIGAWLTAMGMDKAVIAANSYGCEVAVELALRHADQVDCLILTAPASDPVEPTVRQQGLRLLRDAFSESPTMGFVLLWDAFGPFGIGLKRGVETCQIMVDYDYLPRLPLIQHSTLVVRGSKDTVATEPWVERVCKLLPNAELAIIEGGPHDINYSSAQELAKITNNFLENRVKNSR